MINIKNIYRVKVIDRRKNHIIVNGNLKIVYRIPIDEFEEYELEDIVGKEIDVYMSSIDNISNGVAFASYKKAKKEIIWSQVIDMYKNREIITSKIISSTKGGYSVSLGNIEAFLPVSHINIQDTEDIIGKTFNVIIIGINKLHNNVIVSNKEIAHIEIAQDNKDKLLNLSVNTKITCMIKGISNNMIFVDIGNDMNCFIPQSEASYEYNPDLSNIFAIGQKITAIVKEIKSNARVMLSIIDTIENPFEKLSVLDKIKVKPFHVYAVSDSDKENIADDSKYIVFGKESIYGLMCKMSSEDSRFSKEEVMKMIGDNIEFDCVVKYKNIDANCIIVSSSRTDDEKWNSFLQRYVQSKNGLVDFIVKDKSQGVIYATNEDFKTVIPLYELSHIDTISEYEKVKIGDKITVKVLYMNEDKKHIVCSKRIMNKNTLIEVLNKLMNCKYVVAKQIYQTKSQVIVSLDGLMEISLLNKQHADIIKYLKSHESVNLKVIGYNRSNLMPRIIEYEKSSNTNVGVSKIMDVFESFDNILENI